MQNADGIPLVGAGSFREQNKSDGNDLGGDTKPPVQGVIIHEVYCLAAQYKENRWPGD